jgi:serine/threonine-protein kinase
MSSPAPSADRNLIFGLLALQMDFVSREQLLGAMGAWMLRKTTPLGDILRERGVLGERRLKLLDELVEEHVEQHGDAGASLAALRVEASIRQDLDRLDDADVQVSLASLVRVLPATPATRTRPGALAESVSSPAALASSMAAPAADDCRFRRLREHARGGLGEVFVALDSQLNREVALKEIQERFADQVDARFRFLREAEITGKLEHPGVVPVYGLGAYPDGRLYYAMRFIRGETMQDAIQRFHEADEDARRDTGERRLALRELLSRFVAMCQAVGYAHARGVIHRDLKPANVMLGEYGETLVVDWGLARLLEQADPEATTAGAPVQVTAGSGSTSTELGQVLGTPSYMSPEQALGQHDDVGIASEVFALGATLYCLLTGAPPYPGHDAVVQAARGEIVPARQRKPSVPAALESICTKAMAARSADRYRKAQTLADEVQRFLADEPVTAYREPLPERLRRWGRRHRTLVSVGVALLLAGVAALGAGLWFVSAEEQRTAGQRDRAIQAEQEATANLELAQVNLKLAREAVDECYNVAYKDPLFQGPRMEKARNLLLRKTLKFYKNFRAQQPNDRALQHEEANQWLRVGNIEQVLVRAKDAQEAYERARNLYRALVAAHPDLPEYQQDLAGTHHNLGILLKALGRREEALKEYQQARTLQWKLVAAHPELSEYQKDLAGTHNILGVLLEALGKREEALLEYQQARTLGLKLVAAHPELPEFQNYLAFTHNHLGLLLRDLGKREEALKEYQQARTLQRKLAAAHPELPEYQNDLAFTYNNLGILLRDLGEREEALKEYQQARTLGLKLVAAHPELPEHQKELARTHNGLGNLLRDMGKREEALKEYQEARALGLKLVAAHPDLPEYQHNLASTHFNLGNLLSDLDRRDEALKEYQQARTLRLKLVAAHPELPEYQNDLAGTHTNLGALLSALGKRDESLMEYQQARTLGLKLVAAHPDLPEYSDRLARTCFNRAGLLLQINRQREALVDLDEGIRQADRLRTLDPNNPMSSVFLMDGLTRRGSLLLRLGRASDADADWDRVLKIAPVAQRPGLRLQRADSRARACDYLRATAEADELAAAGEVAAEMLYALACIHALDADAAGKDGSRPLAEREKRAEQYARAAVALLGRAAAAGYFRDPERVQHLDKDDDLAGLWRRDDYRAFRKTLTR